MTTIDPANGTDFWTVGEYYANTSSFNWHTRVGKFNFGDWWRNPNADTDRFIRPPAVGQPVRTCLRLQPARLGCFSQLTGSFM